MAKHAPVVSIICIAILVMMVDVLPTAVLAVLSLVAVAVVGITALIDWDNHRSRHPVIELRQRSIGIQDADGNLVTEVQPVVRNGIKGWAVHGDVNEGFYADEDVTIWIELE